MAVGGSWLAKKDVIKAKNWDEIARNAEAAREVKEKVRGA
jgi:2-keto-3-deoxy-6-phosphogluconate aldolase